MKISKVCIKNFRVYNGEFIFELDKNITIFYGENGFGKSSFFDAIEWCLTGTINRFQDDGNITFAKLDIINRPNRNKNTDCYVSISFDDGYTLCRQFNINNGETQRVNVKVIDSNGHVIITGEAKVSRFLKEYYVKNDNTIGQDLLGSLIKQTHILSQDEVTDFVLRDDPKERYKALATIMGLKPVMNLTKNLKVILSKLKVLEEEKTSVINQYLITIKSRTDSMETINKDKMLKIVNDISLDLNSENLEEQIQQKNQQTYHRQIKLNEKLEVLKKVNESGYKSIKNLVLEEESIRAKLVEQVALERKLNNLSLRTENKFNILKEKILTIPNLVELKNYQLSLKNKIQVYVTGIKSKGYSPNILLDELDSLINQEVTKKKRIAYILAYKDEYLKAQELINSLPSAIQVNQEKMKKLLRTSSRSNKAISKLSSQSNDDNFLTETANLLDSLNRIYEYVKNHNHNGICPVCSSEHGDNLLSLIKSNINERVKSLSSNKERVIKLSDLIKKVKKKIEINNTNIKDLDYKINQLLEQLSEQNNKISRIKSNKYFNETLFNESSLKLLQFKNDCEQKEKNLINIKDNRVELNLLKDDYKKICYDISKNKVFLNLLPKLKLRLNVFKRENAIIKSIIAKKENEINSYKQDLLNLQTKLKKVSEVINNNESSDDIINLINVTASNIIYVNQIISDIEFLKEEYVKEKLNKKFSEEIIEIKNKLENENLNLNKINNYRNLVSNWLESLNETFGEHAMEFVNRRDSSIQRYYRYMNPVPASNTEIHFTAEEQLLNIQIKNGFDDYLENARYTLSSAQLNILAIAIFLAMNESQIFNLEFVAIDDPIQNMDDVNQFSLCDILSNLNKQVLFSTHDLDFIKLYVKKNEHRNQSIRVFILKSAYLTPEKIEVLDFK